LNVPFGSSVAFDRGAVRLSMSGERTVGSTRGTVEMSGSGSADVEFSRPTVATPLLDAARGPLTTAARFPERVGPNWSALR
jgi:hypothetical protein